MSMLEGNLKIESLLKVITAFKDSIGGSDEDKIYNEALAKLQQLIYDL